MAIVLPPQRRLLRRAQRDAAFVLIELAVVVMVIGVLSTLAVPAAKKLVIVARGEAVINDLRVFRDALQHYVQERGDWPEEEATAGALPAGLGSFVHEASWSRVTPIGGHYNWDYNRRHQGERYRAVIAITGSRSSRVSSDRAQLLEIDRKLDDGDLETGRFRLGFRNYPIFVLER